MNIVDQFIHFCSGRRSVNKSLTKPNFPIRNEIVKDHKISDLIPRYGKNYYRLVSDGGSFQLYLRLVLKSANDISDARSTLLKKYNSLGVIGHKDYTMDLEKLLPYIDSVIVDGNKKTKDVIYIFRFIEMNEEVNIDGYLKTTNAAGRPLFEKYVAAYVNH